ncbi:MAG: RNA degradosome polyphosphate kinase, partial [Opitutales bacterium]
GICGLVPGVKGFSENIRIRSILGRYLEHSRIYYFENKGDEPVILVGSADWMPRNFFSRIEAIFPIENTNMIERIKEILGIYLKDNEFAKTLEADGSYKTPRSHKKKPRFSAQGHLAEIASSTKPKN